METITITSIRKETDSNFTDLVNTVNYNLSVTIGGETESGNFQCTLGYPEVGDNIFTAYNSVTQEKVKEWVKGSPEYGGDLNSLVFIIQERTATNITDFPWS
tara:strand:- start:954 stop:1259 length:306 start_codon:yes stop_codon:yes gene_type:complete